MKLHAVGSVQPCTAVSEKLALLMSKKIEPCPFTLIRAACGGTRGQQYRGRSLFGNAFGELVRPGVPSVHAAVDVDFGAVDIAAIGSSDIPQHGQFELPARLMLVLGYVTKKGPVEASIKKVLVPTATPPHPGLLSRTVHLKVMFRL